MLEEVYVFPTSFAQQRLWFLDQMEPGNPTYNIAAGVRLNGYLNEGALVQSLNEVVRRHESLRTVFTVVEEQPVQVIQPTLSLTLPVVDLRELVEDSLQAEAQRLSAKEAQGSFNLAKGPLLRTTLLRLGNEEYLLLISMHHIICDGWSIRVLVRELATLYEAFCEGRQSPLEDLEIQYADFAQWQRMWLQGEAVESELSYWKEQLAGAPAILELPTDRPRPPVRDYQGARQSLVLAEDLTEALKELSRRERVTFFMTLLTAFNILLHRHTGQDDIVVGTPIAGRNESETEGLIGFFLNTLVLRTRVLTNCTFRDLLGSVREVMLGAYAHQSVPFERLLEELQPERDLNRTPLFQVFFNMLNFPENKIELPLLTAEILAPPEIGSKFDLTLYLEEQSGRLKLDLVYNSTIFGPALMAEMVEQFKQLLSEIAQRPDELIMRYCLVTAAAEKLLPNPALPLELEWTGAVHQSFARQARNMPQHPAVVDNCETITYEELDARSNQLANYLIAHGIKPQDIVTVYAHRSAKLVVALLGIVKAGAAFVLLDTAYPASRLLDYLEKAKPKGWIQIKDAETPPDVLEQYVATLSCRIELPQSGTVAELDSLERYSTDDPNVRVGPEDAVYVSFTSGSTGKPKGIVGKHGSLAHFAQWASQMFGINETDRFTMLSGLSHDPLHRDIFTPLQLGATICIPAPDDIGVPARLAEWINQRQITIANLTPAMGQVLGGAISEARARELSSLRYAFFVGDALTRRDVRRLRKLAPTITIVNLYGATETSRAVGYFIVPNSRDGQGRAEKEILPLGRGISGVELLIINSSQQLAGIGEIGEIYFRSPYIAKGYLRDDELTQERFIINPFTNESDDRLYKTGDLGRYLSDGNIESLGRSDTQVKIRGYRVELGEIEAALGQHTSVREIAVIAREDIPGDKRLVAYIVPHLNESPAASELRAYLKNRLPDYMIPAMYMMLDALPLTPNAKLDRRALPAPEPTKQEGLFIGPRTAIEEILAEIWAEIFRLDKISVHDNFFGLGGHSLLATQVISRVRSKLNVELPLRSLFESPTVSGMAEAIEMERRSGQAFKSFPINPISRDQDMPLSFAQQRLWLLDQLQPRQGIYNIPAAVRLKGILNIAALQNGLNEIIRRHESLRTRFVSVNGQPSHVIAPTLSLTLFVVDIDGLPESAKEDEVSNLSIIEGQQPFILTQGPLLRVRLIRLREDEHVLLVTMHHIISDGWSLGVFVRELTALYEAISKAKSSSLAELPIQYADFAYWQRRWLEGEVLESQLSYWKQQLDNELLTLELPSDRPRPAVQTFRGAKKTLKLSAALTEQLNALNRKEGVTLFMTLLAAFKTLLYRYTGQNEIVVGTPIAGRSRGETQDLIGLFVNTLVMRSSLSGELSFRELLWQVREVALGAYAHQDLPFERLVEELQPRRDLTRQALFQVMFILQNAPYADVQLPDLSVSSIPVDNKTAKFDLLLSMVERAEGLTGTLEYSTDLFDEITIDRMLGHLQTLLWSIVGDGQQRLSDLQILSKQEREQLVTEWNQTKVEYPADKCIHELIESQVERTPEAVAVIFEGGQLTYRELNSKANQLARYLRRLGVGPDVMVGICIERSAEMLVGLLGILKAGGAYVPLDPTYPKHRLAFILEDAQAPLLLTEAALVARLDSHPMKTVCLDADWPIIAQECADNQLSPATSDNLAYVIYTSGSTGKPKGVQIPHRAVVNFLNSMRQEPGLTQQDTLIAVTTLSFDIAGLELFLPIIVGGCVLIVSREMASDGVELSKQIDKYGATVMQATPATWRLLLEAGWQGRDYLKILCGGEALPKELAGELSTRSAALWNMYGPTETTIWSAVYKVERENPRALIGRPIANTVIYLLDPNLQLVPVGVSGELYISGDGLARGYFNRPDLTAEKFIPNPFGDLAQTRLYKTGDRARFLPDGNIEFLDRIDNQVKLRGFRIEPGEIEAVLRQHGGVKEAVVAASEDASGEKLLAAYILPNPDYHGSEDEQWQSEQVSQWQMAWDDIYDQASPHPDPAFNIVGWNSSYTGEPIAAIEMREWIDNTAERILSLQPSRVLEIGCGTGMVLFRVAPHCVEYCGTDFSAKVLGELQQRLSVRGLTNVSLAQGSAEDINIESEAFDLVILNSVVQYFPSVDYLLGVIEAAIKSIEPGGHLFIGDVRCLPLLESLHASIEIHHAQSSLSKARLQQRVCRQINDEEELVIDPAFFIALKHHLPQITHVEIHPKRGSHHNELTRFRYDVILNVAGETSSRDDLTWLDWQKSELTLEDVRKIVSEEKPDFLGITGVPNARLQAQVKMVEFLSHENGLQTVGDLREVLRGGAQENWVDPEDIYELGEDLPYGININWSGSGADGRFDVAFKRKESERPQISHRPLIIFPTEPIALRPLSHYANNPLRGKFSRRLVPRLRRFLQDRLPEYMNPSKYVLMETMPLTPNGKIDRRALPAVDEARPDLFDDYIKPSTPTQEILVNIWSTLLNVERVGISDSFFRSGRTLTIRDSSGVEDQTGLRSRDAVEGVVRLTDNSATGRQDRSQQWRQERNCGDQASRKQEADANIICAAEDVVFRSTGAGE